VSNRTASRRTSEKKLIHRSAWKVNSAKFVSRIVDRTPPEGREDGFCGPSRHEGGHYMLWWRIKIRAGE
jgi:hypothetical protein